MKQLGIIFYILNLLFIAEAGARPLSKENFKFKKEIRLTKEPKDGKIVRLELDEDVFKNSFSTDIRVAHKGEILPYLRRQSKELLLSHESITPKVIFQKQSNEEELDITVLELPKLSEGFVYNELTINRSTNYESNISIYLGDSPSDFPERFSSFVYSYGDRSSNQIDLNGTKFRYIRIESNIGSNLEFLKVSKSKEALNLYFSTDVEWKEPSLNEGKTEYNFSNEKRTYFQKIKLDTAESTWERRILVLAKKDKKNWETAFEQTVRKLDSKPVYLPLNFTAVGEFKIQFFDYENDPIRLKTVTLMQPKEELLFFAPPNLDPKEFYLYYGNPYQWPPQFDPLSIPDSSPSDASQNVASATLSEQIDNSEYAFSFVQPPFSGIVANVLFYIGIFSLLGLVWRIQKKKSILIQRS
ncbi:MAG: hypothetical protein O9301_14235 [Leptospira sp.]|nr:hypothetical protein [Leptospira sp.]